MDRALEAIRVATEGTPYEGHLWVVGGAVRDRLLNRPQANDLDIVLESSALELAEMLWEDGVSTIAPVVYPRFGTALIRVAGCDVELATARRESYDVSSRKPNVEPATLQQDALRRDFTVNTLMLNVHTNEILDSLGSGLGHLFGGILQTPLDADSTFHDDPLRMLRAIRFRWQLGFQPAGGLYEAIVAKRDRLQIISMERVRDEWVKMLLLPDADRCFADMMATGLIEEVAPELCAMVGVEQGNFHHLDVWDHSLLALRRVATGDVVLSLATLLHDCGKPATRMVDGEGRTRFFGHEGVSGDIARTILRRLKFPTTDIDAVVKLVRSHMRLSSSPTFSHAAARRLLRDLGPWVEPLLSLVEADAAALKPGVKELDLGAVRQRLGEVAASTPRDTLKSPLSGAEIMALGVEEGPIVGRIKEMLAERVIEGDLDPTDKAKALQTTQDFLQEETRALQNP